MPKAPIRPFSILALTLALALAPALGCVLAGPALAKEEKKVVPCTETTLKFDVPDYKVECEDRSDGSVNVDSMSVGVRIYTLHAFSAKEQAFLDVVDDHILGSSYIFYNRHGFQADIEQRYDARFSDWGNPDEIDGFEVRPVSVRFEGDDSVDCLAFRKEGPRRYSGIGGITVGMTCSYKGPDNARSVLKQFLDQR
jgi:hypothetical protein